MVPIIDCKQCSSFLSISCNWHFLQLINTTEYLKSDAAQVLTSLTKFPPFKFDSKTFLSRQKYSFGTFFLISSHLSCNNITTLRFDCSIPTAVIILHFFNIKLAHFSIQALFLCSRYKKQIIWNNESNYFSFLLYNFKSPTTKRSFYFLKTKKLSCFFLESNLLESILQQKLKHIKNLLEKYIAWYQLHLTQYNPNRSNTPNRSPTDLNVYKLWISPALLVINAADRNNHKPNLQLLLLLTSSLMVKKLYIYTYLLYCLHS